MTDEEFVARCDAIGHHFLGARSCDVTKHAFRSGITTLVREFYQGGGFLADAFNEPIYTIEEVELVIDMSPHKISATAVRRT